MSTYAAQTDVPSDRSRAEIERTLQRYQADQFLYGWKEQTAVVAFRIQGRHVRMEIPLPRRDDPAFTKYRQGGQTWLRAEPEARRRYEQAVRQRWRALALVIKAKLEAAEAGITSIEDEFLSATITADGTTVSEWLQPQLAEMYATGQMPALLPGLPDVPRLPPAGAQDG